jgi:hypothetical protein
MTKQDILVVSFPKCGATWTSRLLGDILNSPVTGYMDAHPICEEGLDRPGDYIVRQLHLKARVRKGENFLENAWECNMEGYTDERIVLVVRDPRDVSVALWKYFEIDSLEKTINCMAFGEHPFIGVGSINEFIAGWMRYPFVPMVSYESLTLDTYATLSSLLMYLDIEEPPGIHEAIERQSFKVRKAELEKSESKYNYGATIQTKNLRKGVVGDWRNHYTKETCELAEKLLGTTMRLLNYEKDRNWISRFMEGQHA